MRNITISLIDDSPRQLEQIKSFIEMAAMGVCEIKINTISDIENLQNHMPLLLESDYIFCDLHFKDTEMTGDRLLHFISLEGFSGKAYILSGDLVAIDSNIDMSMRYVSKMNIMKPAFLLKLLEIE